MNRFVVAATAASALALLGEPVLAAQKTQPSQITCKEFLDLDQDVRPRIVYYLVGYNQSGKPDAAEVEEIATRPLATAVVEECKTAPPKTSLWEKIKSKL